MAYDQNAFQLTHLLQRAYRRLKVARTSTATGGSATTIVDTKLPEYLADSHENDILNNGSVIIIADAGGAGASPEGKFSRISDYAATSADGTITISTVTDAVASGDTYMYISPDFPLLDMIEVVNDALVSLGRIPKVYSSITTVANQTEYALPVLLKGVRLSDIELQGILTDSDDNRYTSISGWKITPANPGSTGLITIPQFAAGYILRIGYPGLHPRVSAYSDYISEYIHPELATACVTAYALQWYNSMRGGADDYWKQREDRAWNQLDIAKANYPILRPAGRVQGFPHWESSGVGFRSQYVTNEE
jgi:hypothetical protein